MKTQVTFRSNKFPPYEGEQEQINPGLWGKRLAEYLVPSLRSLYLSPAERTTFADAGAYAERYRAEAEQLNDREKRNRTEGVALDDYGVARISSFLKSYGEMRKGEQFVMDEVRARARERVRWGASLGLLVLALLLAPIPRRRLWARPRRT